MMTGKTRQRGVSFFILIFMIATLVSAGLVAAQVMPTYLEYNTAVKAINKAKEGATVQEVRNIFDRAAQIDNITSVEGKDLEITKNGDKVVVSFAYNKELHLAGPAFLLLKYTATSTP